MNKKFLTHVAALSLAAVVMVPSAMALSWLDGAPANYKFTYADGDAGIVSVTASDTNGTFYGEVKEGQTITTKTGTIAWRDSYTNTTTFTVEVKPGYELVGLTGDNVNVNDFTKNDNGTYSFQFTDKGAEAWCYGKDVNFNLITSQSHYFVDTYSDGTFFKSTELIIGSNLDNLSRPAKLGYTFDHWTYKGKEVHELADVLPYADENNHIRLDAAYSVNYYTVTFQGENGEDYGFITASLGEPLSTSIVPKKEGHTFSHWMFGDEKMPDTLTMEMINQADGQDNIIVTPAFTVNQYSMRINCYEDNTQGRIIFANEKPVDYGTVIDSQWLTDNGYLTSEYKIIGGSDHAVTVGVNGATIDLVKYTPAQEDFWSYEYGFLFGSKTADIKSVEYSIDGNDWTSIDVNEDVKFNTTIIGADRTKAITFRVKVAEDMQLDLTVDHGEDTVSFENGYYTFTFTRTAHQGWNEANFANVTFNLSAVAK